MSRCRIILASCRIFVIAILVMFAFVEIGGNNFPILNKAGAVSRSITLVGNFNGWNLTTNKNPTITVTQGDTVTVSLSSVDSTHQFEVFVNKIGYPDCSAANKCSSMFTMAMPTTYTFNVDFAPGTYTYYCTLHPGSMFGSFIVQGPDFALSPNPASIGPLNTGAKGVSTISVTPSYGFNGQVMLTSSPSSGLTAVLNPAGISGGSGTSQLTVNSTTAGSYTVTVTGTSGTLTHSITIAVSVVAGDFSISITPATLSIAIGSSGNFTVQLQSLSGFSGSVNLTPSISPTGTFSSAIPASVSLSSGGAGTSVVTVRTTGSGGLYSSPTPSGTYILTVVGSSGAISHSATANANVGTTPNPSPTRIDPIVVEAGIAVAVVIAIAASATLIMRNRSKK